MGKLKHVAKKKRLIAQGKIRLAPIWANIRKFSLKRARTRRIRIAQASHWRGSKLKK